MEPIDQNYITICIPLKWPRKNRDERENDLNELLDSYGNPLGESITDPGADHGKKLKEVIEQTGVIHFMSISLIASEQKARSTLWSFLFGEPRSSRPFLVIEMSIDGKPSSALNALFPKQKNRKEQHPLAPIFKQAMSFKSARKIKQTLKRYKYKLFNGVPAFTARPNRALGLPFCGADGLTVPLIRADADIHDVARFAIDEYREQRAGDGSISANSIYGNIREIFSDTSKGRAELEGLINSSASKADRSDTHERAIEILQDPERMRCLRKHISDHNNRDYALKLNQVAAVKNPGIWQFLGLARTPIIIALLLIALCVYWVFAPRLNYEIRNLHYIASQTDTVHFVENIAPNYCDRDSDTSQNFIRSLSGEDRDYYLQQCEEHTVFDPPSPVSGEKPDETVRIDACNYYAHDTNGQRINLELDPRGRMLWRYLQSNSSERNAFSKCAEPHHRMPVVIAQEVQRIDYCEQIDDWHKLSLEEKHPYLLNTEQNFPDRFKGLIRNCDYYFKGSTVSRELRESLSYLIAPLITILGLTSILMAMLALLLRGQLRKSERQNTPQDFDPDPSTVRDMMLRENRTPAQNHMISVTHIIPGGLRKRIALPLSFHAIKKSILNKWFRSGFLSDIGTIHFARWVCLPGTNRLVFFSNYDANWESYLEDFITKADSGLTGVWSNCVGFPKTENLFQEGAKDGDRFKRWARRSMIPTRLWYSAYPDLSIQQIRRNALVRLGLTDSDDGSTTLNRTNAQAWLNLFDSDQRPLHALEFDDIQTLLLRGGRALLEGRCLSVAFPSDRTPEQLSEWIGDVRRRVTTGDQKPEEAVYLALSAPGLARLGLEEEVATDGALTTSRLKKEVVKFPSAFSLGMDSPTREAVTGDDNGNAPALWNWGDQSRPETESHAVLLLYAKTEAELNHLYNKINAELTEHGLKIAQEIKMRALPEHHGDPIKEPFGWTDGISNPVMEGLTRRSKGDPINTVQPGEFILGYHDNRGYFPPTPKVLGMTDPAGHLSLPPDYLPGKFPTFESHHTRDFGRNGSFLIIRQLEQDVDAFTKWTEIQADELRAKLPELGDDVTPEYVGAKLVGRWKDGKPLVRWPHSPDIDPELDARQTQASEGSASDGTAENKPKLHPGNDFLYGKEDPQGHRCPLGAHIRRANPRDSLNQDNELALEIANRHRILRRGRTYYEEDANGEQSEGTLFMCLNVDIERQFEFIQQNWVNAPRFHGLDDEVDPITGQHDQYSRFSMPTSKGPVTLKNWTSFVTMKGGGYFFLPSLSALDYLAEPRRLKAE